MGEETGVVLEARVAERDHQWHLARAEFRGGSLWVRDIGIEVGGAIRVRVLARDVSLSLGHHEGTSILNLLQARVEAVAEEGHPAVRLVGVRVGETPLIARLTARSAHNLALEPGKPIWVQIKSVAVIE